MKTIKATDFFNSDYVDQASYDNLRKIASLVDGQKNASRKVLYTVLEKKIQDKIKVSQLGSKVSEYAEYLHGLVDDVITGLAQDFVGTNNVPLLQKKGNFGTRFSPEPSASRYIYTYGSKEFFEFFKNEDKPILKHQFFEGHAIEPMFYVPVLPIILINGSNGVSSGFAQKILPRNPEEIKKYIVAKLKGKKPKANLTPYYKGFKGTIEQGDNSSQWLIKGVVDKISINRVQISEVPIGYNLKSYLQVLDDLEDNKIIQSYKDKSENDNFLFEVQIPSKVIKDKTNDELLKYLKLIKKVTENYTVINHLNKIEVCDSAEDILNKYIDVKLHYLNLRKQSLISELNENIKFNKSKSLFIKLVTNEELTIYKRKKDDIVKDLEDIDGIYLKDGSYDYLLNMNIISLTIERMKRFDESIIHQIEDLQKLQNTPVQRLWMDEL